MDADLLFIFFRHSTCGQGTHMQHFVATMNVSILAGLVNKIRYVHGATVHFLLEKVKRSQRHCKLDLYAITLVLFLD